MRILEQLQNYVDLNSITKGEPFDYESYIEMGSKEAPNLFFEKRGIDDRISLVTWNTTEKGLQKLIYTSLSGVMSHAAEISFRPGTYTGMHTHDYVEFVYVVQGRLVQILKGKTITFTQGEICIVDKDTLHSDILLWEDSTILCLGIDNAMLENSSKLNEVSKEIIKLILRKKSEYSFVHFVPKENGVETAHTFEVLFEELLHDRPNKSRIIREYIERLIQQMSLEYRIVLNRKERHELSNALIHDMLNYIEQNYADITVQKLSEMLKYNADYLSKLCIKKTGLSISQIIQKIRMEKALELLESTQLSVDEISRLVGYNNIGFFYKKFKEFYHTTPNKIRSE